MYIATHTRVAIFYFNGHRDPRDLHSFPTRRSSDLDPVHRRDRRRARKVAELAAQPSDVRVEGVRSEEHTSELQSQSNLVCRLLLEKKKIPRAEQESNVYDRHHSASTRAEARASKSS